MTCQPSAAVQVRQGPQHACATALWVRRRAVCNALMRAGLFGNGNAAKACSLVFRLINRRLPVIQEALTHTIERGRKRGGEGVHATSVKYVPL